MKTINVSTPPTDYSGWVECFEKLSDGIPDDEFNQIISQSTCPEYRGIKTYLHPQLEKAVNHIVNSCLSVFRRDVLNCFERQEIMGLHLVFIRFSRRINKCMFFIYIPFLEKTFKNDLYKETKRVINDFWLDLINSIKNESNYNSLIQEELHIIKRIHLFEKIEINNGVN